MLNRIELKQLILLFTLSIIKNKVKGENLCLSNFDCAKYNSDIETHVCIRFDGQPDYACYISSEAYCDSDATCQGINPSLKHCYVPPWVTNQNSQKQCFTTHEVGGTCVESYHCAEGLVCSNNVCTLDISAPGAAAVIKSGAVATADTNTNTGSTTNANANANTNTNANADADADANADKNTSTGNTDVKSTNSTSSAAAKSKAKTTKSTSKPTGSIELDDYDDEDNKDKPIEILGLPLWAFIVLATVPVVFLIAVLWGLAIGRRSYREEEERKKGRMALKNSKKDMEINYKGVSSENLLPQSTSDLSVKDSMLKNYIQENKKKNDAVPSSVSSNSTIGNNLTAVTVEGKGKASPYLDVPKTRKQRKSDTSSTNSEFNIPPKPKKPKSIVNSEVSDTNSHKGLLAAGQPMGMSAADSGIYSSYFGGGAASTVSSSYFQQPMGVPQVDPAMTALYYQQYMAAQAQQAAAAQQYMTQYMGMPTVDMMQQYQQMYGMGMAYPGMDATSSTSVTVEKKSKNKGGK